MTQTNRSLREVEREHILSVLEECRGNRTHAAKALDISVRTLRNKLREYFERGFRVPENQETYLRRRMYR